ncbi:MAG: heparinase [Runella slithyformis]|nr:MAG: heparinase [Runella slithyformis]
MRLLKTALHLLQNMGPRYVWFRAGYEIKRRTGLLKRAFPTHTTPRTWATAQSWRQLPTYFFKFDRTAPRLLTPALAAEIAEYQRGNILFFGAQYYPVSNWLTNPETGYVYDISKHWTEIADFSPQAGDIKYVWEKSRSSFLYSLIRYDFHANHDMAETVFAEIESWIAANPVNQGPNWRCSQEIALRVLNWTFALNYYKNSAALTETRFAKIVDSIYWHTLHVEANIDFSRIAVRNNHAITETLTLYLVGLLYPFFKESNRWKKRGKSWFETEIAYQIYEDGTFLQFSMNYHRVVVQLLTWGLQLAHQNQERFAEVVYERARASLTFLRACQDPGTGWLPNYGNNDGALFFKLNNAHYHDYRPQLNALAAALGLRAEPAEDCQWYNISLNSEQLSLNTQSLNHSITQSLNTQPLNNSTLNNSTTQSLNHSKLNNSTLNNPTPQNFKNSGYYLLREADTLTFLRCGAYQNRPFQADNLHMDLWVNGQNMLRDAGSYKYNTDERWTRYFAGTASHNTVMLGDFDQMKKGNRFIWYNWTKKAAGQWREEEDCWVFEGAISAFEQAGNNIWHRRRVTKFKTQNRWIVEDQLENAPPDLPMHQIWHPVPAFLAQFSIESSDENGQPTTFLETEGWFSGLYGQKEPAQRLVFSTPGRYLRTEITQKSSLD